MTKVSITQNMNTIIAQVKTSSVERIFFLSKYVYFFCYYYYFTFLWNTK